MGQLRVAVVPRNPSLPHHLAEEHSIHFREFGGFAERKRSLGIQCGKPRDGETTGRTGGNHGETTGKPRDGRDVNRCSGAETARR